MLSLCHYSYSPGYLLDDENKCSLTVTKTQLVIHLMNTVLGACTAQ
jgi:hypothetical protein